MHEPFPEERGKRGGGSGRYLRYLNIDTDGPVRLKPGRRIQRIVPSATDRTPALVLNFHSNRRWLQMGSHKPLCSHPLGRTEANLGHLGTAVQRLGPAGSTGTWLRVATRQQQETQTLVLGQSSQPHYCLFTHHLAGTAVPT